MLYRALFRLSGGPCSDCGLEGSVEMSSYLVCSQEAIGAHKIPPISVKEFLRNRPRCPFCQAEMKIVFKRDELTDEDKALVRERVKSG